MTPALEAEGQNYKGFVVTKYLPLTELQCTLIELAHDKSGARVIQIANDDPENLFALSFQTLPNSSNGVAHALEHIVLCGSKKFPVKDPFFSMTRRSLNTYMNALTGQDFTVYPASSQVKQDFYNLLEVYLDAVFRPLLKPLSFLQEAHRLSFTTPGDIKSPLQRQGVVYNEMKGAMASGDERLSIHLFRNLLPDLPYAYNSGGDPKDIPTLTYEELVEFHRAFYHPSRCLFFFYGNFPLADHLDFIEQHAFSHVEKIPLLPPLPLQKRFSEPKHIVASYPAAPQTEGIAPKSMIAIGLLTVPISQQTELLALSLIDSLLTDTDVSPLTLALLQSGLCTSADSMIDTEMSEAPWLLICKGCEENSAEKIMQTMRTAIEKIISKGLDSAAIEASLHQLEFERTEISPDRAPFGLTLFFRAILAKQHGAAPEQSLLIHARFQELRNRLANPTYLYDLMRKYWLDNPHIVYLTMKPDPQLHQQEADEEKAALAALQKKLSEAELHAIAEQEKKLSTYQEEVEHQSLDCLPKIQIADVPRRAKDFPLAASSNGSLSICHHPCFTNRILYADLCFDLPAIDYEDLPLLSLMTRMWPEIGSGGRSYAQTLEFQQAFLGELNASLSLHIQHDDPDTCKPTLSLQAKALERNIQPLLQIFSDCSNSSNFLDTGRIKELLMEHATELQDNLTRDAMSYAVQLAASGLSTTAAIHQQLSGLPYFSFISKLTQEAAIKPLCKQLQQLQERMIGAPHPSLVLSCDHDEYKSLSSHLESFAASLPQRTTADWKTNIPLTPTASQGRIIPSPVAFSALAYHTVSYRHEDAPALLVATDLMENTVLHKEIREKGGAYGSGASYSPSSGQFHFYAYRDPHLLNTYQMFLRAIEHIADKKFNTRELLEAKLGVLQDLDAPLPPGKRAICAFGWQRSQRSWARRDAFRQAILDVSDSDVAQAVENHLFSQKDRGVFVSFANADLFHKEAEKLPMEFKVSSFGSR